MHVSDSSLLWLTADPGPWPDEPVEPWCEHPCCEVDEPADRSGAAVPAVSGPASGRQWPVGAGSVGQWAVPGVERVLSGPSPLLAELGRALDAVAGHGPLSGSAVDTAGLLVLAERARALALRELAELDIVGGHRPAAGTAGTGSTGGTGTGGAPGTAATWLRDTRHLSDAAARAAVHLARTLRDDLPEVGGLLAAGTISLEHAAAVAAGVRGLDRDVVTGAQGGLCALAASTDPTEVRRVLRDKAIAVDDRLAADAARRTRARMGLRLSEVGDHVAVDGTLTGEDGAVIRQAMDLAVEADRTEGDTRSRAARHADVLLGWASDYLHQAHGPGDSLTDDAHTIRTHLHVVCTPDQLTDQPGACERPDATQRPGFAELLDRDLSGLHTLPASPQLPGARTALSHATLRRLACDATLTLTVLRDPAATALHTCARTTSTATGVCEHLADPLSVGRSARTVTGRQFNALIVRDRTCIVRGCHRPPSRCAAHHVRHWADGGSTDLPNLVLLCHQHHHDHHDRGLVLTHRDGRHLTQHGWAYDPP